jgi:hypothetical protein
VLDPVALIHLEVALLVFDNDLYLDAASRCEQDGSDFVWHAENIGGFMKIKMTFSKH